MAITAAKKTAAHKNTTKKENTMSAPTTESTTTVDAAVAEAVAEALEEVTKEVTEEAPKDVLDGLDDAQMDAVKELLEAAEQLVAEDDDTLDAIRELETSHRTYLSKLVGMKAAGLSNKKIAEIIGSDKMPVGFPQEFRFKEAFVDRQIIVAELIEKGEATTPLSDKYVTRRQGFIPEGTISVAADVSVMLNPSASVKEANTKEDGSVKRALGAEKVRDFIKKAKTADEAAEKLHQHVEALRSQSKAMRQQPKDGIFYLKKAAAFLNKAAQAGAFKGVDEDDIKAALKALDSQVAAVKGNAK